jgi:hypothetical protein
MVDICGRWVGIVAPADQTIGSAKLAVGGEGYSDAEVMCVGGTGCG